MVLPSFTFSLSVAVSMPFCQLKLSAALTDTAPRRQTASARTLSLIFFFLVPRKVVRGTASQNGLFTLDWQEECDVHPHMRNSIRTSTSFGETRCTCMERT